MDWTVETTRAVEKQVRSLPYKVRTILAALVRQISAEGPVRGDWHNYGKLADGRHHCHLKKGRPTYVAVWEEEKGKVKLVRLIYAGTHGKAPY